VRDCEETRQARCTLASFANTHELPVAVLGLEPDSGANVGLACTGVLHLDLTQVLEDVGQALRATSVVALLCIEELEALDDEALAALIAAAASMYYCGTARALGRKRASVFTGTCRQAQTLLGKVVRVLGVRRGDG
jgi:hypothetical protein